MQFSLFAPAPTDFLNYVRTVSLVRDETRWRFDATGTVQPFEDVPAYQARQVSDRFTAAMLADYAGAFGLDVFGNGFYCGPSVLITHPATPPVGAAVVSLAETRRSFGISL